LDEVLWDARDHVLKINEHFHVTVVPLQLPDEAVHLELPGHGHLLRLALQNIIENACKFSPDHTARIELNREPGAFVILVSDRGPGIPPEDLANILNPFFRSNATSQTKGHGIGLSLVSRIVALHGGTIHFEQRQPGTCVRITIPQRAF
jgi:signal transduction histidine kinase